MDKLYKALRDAGMPDERIKAIENGETEGFTLPESILDVGEALAYMVDVHMRAWQKSERLLLAEEAGKYLTVPAWLSKSEEEFKIYSTSVGFETEKRYFEDAKHFLANTVEEILWALEDL